MTRVLLLGAIALSLYAPLIAESNSHFLLTTSGNVQVKREGWSDYIPVAFGTMLRSADLLKVEGKATVLCANLTVKPAPELGSTPCSDIRTGGEDNGARFSFPRLKRNSPENIPYILYPRNPLVLDRRPLLRWSDTGASTYTVGITQEGMTMLWERTVAGSALPYPADVPPLQPNVNYTLLVRDNDSDLTSDKDPAKGLGFQVVTQNNLASLEATREQISGLSPLAAPARQLALGVYYASGDISENGFRPLGEAWPIFQLLALTQETPAIYLRLSEVLAQLQLPREAKEAYQTTLKSAELLGDSESQAAAHAALWQLTGDETHFNRAISLYQQLGDVAQANVLKEEKGL